MSIAYQPAVRIVLGYAGRADAPPATYASPATLALQKAVTKLGKDWKKVAPMFIVAPAARSGRLVVGLAMSRVPRVLDAPAMVEPNSAIAKEHYVVQGGFREAPDVDKHGEDRARTAWVIKSCMLASFGFTFCITRRKNPFLGWRSSKSWAGMNAKDKVRELFGELFEDE